MFLNITNIPVEKLQDNLFDEKKLQVSVLRLDKIHPVVSGNKIFKLHYFLQQALQQPHKTVATFGGAYSNHLAATAYACNLLGLKSIGIVRGEKPAQLSHTLQQCLTNGMHLHFISRQEYALRDNPDFLLTFNKKFTGCIIIPEGGYDITGAKGAAQIHTCIPAHTFTHICTAAGTATTAAGLLMGSTNQQIICVNVLKGTGDMERRIAFCCNNNYENQQLQVLNQYNFGGYAKKTPRLIAFMNQLWQQHHLPTDFVYTAKMMYAVMDKIKNDGFAPGSNILCIHTGGLQGNNSLPKGTLLF
jgi:1-aminocyclopropane-1-carboxylate deaminase